MSEILLHTENNTRYVLGIEDVSSDDATALGIKLPGVKNVYFGTEDTHGVVTTTSPNIALGKKRVPLPLFTLFKNGFDTLEVATYIIISRTNRGINIYKRLCNRYKIDIMETGALHNNMPFIIIEKTSMEEI